MSCWVVPHIAAELWGCSVEQVLAQIAEGKLTTKHDGGFEFVDVAPDSPTIETPKALRPVPPPTYTVVSREEIMALVGAAGPEGDEESMDISDWREKREEAGRTRRAPATAIAA